MMFRKCLEMVSGIQALEQELSRCGALGRCYRSACSSVRVGRGPAGSQGLYGLMVPPRSGTNITGHLVNVI